MAIIKVGPDDSTFGLFGHKRTTVEFNDAIKLANRGDIIQIQAGYKVPFKRNNNYFINKDLTIMGEESEDSPSIIENPIIISNANVTLKNIMLQSKENFNIISLTKKAYLKCFGVKIFNEVVDSLKVATLSVSSDCKMDFDNGYIAGGMESLNPAASHIYIKGTANIYNSRIGDRLFVENGVLTVTNSEISYSHTNAIYGKASIINIENTRISGGYMDENGGSTFPCVKLMACNLAIKDSSISQPVCDTALDIETNSKVLCDNLIISSIGIFNSNLELRNNSRLLQSLYVGENCTIKGDQILIDGMYTDLVSLYIDSGSKVNANWIGFGIVKGSEVKMSKDAILDADLHMLEYDPNKMLYTINNDKFVLAENLNVSVQYIEDFNVPATNSNSSNEEDDEMKLINEDIEEIKDTIDDPSFSADQELENMIGLTNVKNQVKEFVAVATINKKREEKGLSVSSQTLHSIFAGNPGTGKTTVARLLGQILYQKGVIKKNLLVEASRTDLVAEYIGQTAPKTRKVLEKALGGVLFIDEAYTLTPESQNDFGGEAIDEILKFMEDHRSEIMIIFAGYSNEMKKFLEVNPGLQSRIPNVFEFEDYTEDELAQLGLLSLDKEGFEIDKQLYSEKLKAMYSLTNDHSNGRWVRNFNEVIKRKQAVRLASEDPDSITEEDLTVILPEDIENITETS